MDASALLIDRWMQHVVIISIIRTTGLFELLLPLGVSGRHLLLNGTVNNIRGDWEIAPAGVDAASHADFFNFVCASSATAVSSMLVFGRAHGPVFREENGVLGIISHGAIPELILC
jgi:hypothetical protein